MGVDAPPNWMFKNSVQPEVKVIAAPATAGSIIAVKHAAKSRARRMVRNIR
jgi:hypothetical protein